MLIDELKESNNIKLLTWRRKANPSRALGRKKFEHLKIIISNISFNIIKKKYN
jgi:hypothetical protein